MFHKRSQKFGEADLVICAGVIRKRPRVTGAGVLHLQLAAFEVIILPCVIDALGCRNRGKPSPKEVLPMHTRCRCSSK